MHVHTDKGASFRDSTRHRHASGRQCHYPQHTPQEPGCTHDNHLLFDTHISEISKTVYGTIMHVNRLGEYFNKNTRIIVIQSLAMSITDYGISIWGTTNSSHFEQVQKL